MHARVRAAAHSPWASAERARYLAARGGAHQGGAADEGLGGLEPADGLGHHHGAGQLDLFDLAAKRQAPTRTADRAKVQARSQ